MGMFDEIMFDLWSAKSAVGALPWHGGNVP